MKKKRVICNEKRYEYITFGNTYDVDREGDSYFYIKDDEGDSSCYGKNSFSVVNQTRSLFIQWIKNFING